MAYQQSQIPCLANSWTQICQYRRTRKSLSVQCPQVATVTADASLAILDDGAIRPLLAANALRARVVFSLNFVNATTTNISVGPGASGNGVGLYQSTNTAVNSQWDSGESQTASQAWNGIVSGTGAHGQVIEILTETYQCPAIILATTQNPVVSGGPYGSQPPGYWIQSDPGSGPTIFTMSDDQYDEQVMQQWFCWPVGTVAVNVTVSETWAEDQPPPVPEKFRVDLPRLSPDAIAALNDLLARMSQFDEKNAVAETP